MNETVNEDFSEYLKALRVEKDLTLNELANLTGYSDAYISQVEKGRRKNPPSLELLKRLSESLNVRYSVLLEKAGYEELAKGQMLLEFFGARIEIPATETVSPGDPYMTSVEKDILERLGKSIPADNVEQVLTDNQSTVEQHVTANNLYDLKRVLKQISKPVTFGDDTLTVKEKAMLYDFVEIMLKHRED